MAHEAGPPLDETTEELYEQAPCGYLSTRPDGTIVRLNQTLLEWMGCDRDALVGTRLQTHLAVGSRLYYETHLAPLLRMQGSVNEVALELLLSDGRVLPVIANARQKSDATGTPIVNRISVFNATDRRRYERELLLARRRAEQSVKDKTDLLSMLSHDIRNPLSAMMGIVHLLERSELTERQRSHLQILKSSSTSMLTLLNRVLDLSRAEATAFSLAEGPVAILPVVEEAVEAFSAPAEQKGIALRCDVADDVPPLVVTDTVALRQILTNLIANAVKFTEKGEVNVIVRARERATDAVALEFTVSDTGIGIPPALADRIFEEFTQASYDTAARYGGSGLGLAITRRLLALYGSTMRLESTPGEGSRFSFVLRLSLPS